MSSPTKQLLLAGCGALGTALAQALSPTEWAAWGLRRNADQLPPPITPWSADLLTLHKATAPTNFSHVVYSATPGQFTPEAYKQTYVQGLQQLLGLLDKQHTPVERIIFVSSTSVYGQEQGEIVTEESETAPKGFSGQTMLEAEANLSKHAIPSTIVRFGGIYGPTRSLSLLQKVKRGEASLQPDPSRMTNRIHQDDCVGILAHLLHHPQPASLYLGVDSTPVSYNEVISWMAQELDAPPPTLITPARPSRRQPTNKQCCNQRIREDGYQFSFPSFREGYREIITKHHPTSPQTDA